MAAVGGYSNRFREEDFDEFKAIAEELASRGPFDANAFLGTVLDRRMPRAQPVPGEPGALDPNVNAGDAVVILGDLVDLGVLRRIDSEPPMWEAAPD
jgi:hypothetical protein